MPAIADHVLAEAETQPAFGHCGLHTHTDRVHTCLCVLGDVTVTLKMIQEYVSKHHHSVLLTQRQSKYLVAVKMTVPSCVRHGLFCGLSCVCMHAFVCVCNTLHERK